MAIVPPNIARVPNLLSSQISLGSLNRTNRDILSVQNQLSSNRSIVRASEDSARASTITTLRSRLQGTTQRLGNLAHGSSVLASLDTALGSAIDSVREAQSIASSQIGVGSDRTTRAQQATNISAIIDSLVATANQSFDGIHYFGGSTPTRPPIIPPGAGFRYVAEGDGLRTDLGAGNDIPITIGGQSALGQTSARLVSPLDLNPNLTPQAALTTVRGGRGLGVAPGSVSISFNGGPAASIDLTGARSVQDVLNTLTIGIRDYEADNSVTVLGPGGVTLNGSRLSIDIVAGGSLAVAEVANGTTGADLGLTTAPFTPATPTSGDLDPNLTLLTPLSAIPGLALPLGSVRLRSTTGAASVVRDVDLSSAQTFDDVRNLIESAGLGARLAINDDGRGLTIVTEVSGPALSVEEVPGGANTAEALGIRSLAASTPLADFNNGRGVRIVNGSTNPVTGLPDPARDVDFTITLGNGQSFTVDLRPADLTSVQTVIDAINAARDAAVTGGLIPAGAIVAELTDGANGLALRDTGALGPIAVAKANNSPAAQDLGLLDGVWNAGSATFLAQDRATIRVENVLTHLINLRDALLRDDSTGITLAGEDLAGSADRLLEAQGLVGSYGRRIDQATTRLQDAQLVDEQTLENLQGLDFAAAATRFSLLQNQLEATLSVTARAGRLSLFDFLG